MSGGYKEKFKNLLEDAAAGNSNIVAEMDFMFSFDRNFPETALNAKGWHNKTLDSREANDLKII